MSSTNFVRILAILALVLNATTARAQVVQMPSVHSFGTSGAVNVPDMGDATLGGNRSMRSGSVTSGAGPLSSRSFGSGMSGGSASVNAVIIDLQAMDEAILGQTLNDRHSQSKAAAAANKPNAAAGADNGNASGNSKPGRQPKDRTHGPVASGFHAPSTGTPIMNTLTPTRYAQRTDNHPHQVVDRNSYVRALGPPRTEPTAPANDIAGNDNDVRYYLQRASQAEASGRVAAARVYYNMALQRLTPQQLARYEQIRAARSAEAPSEADKKAKAGNNIAGAATASAASNGSNEAGAMAPDASGAASSAANPFDAPAPAADAMGASPF